METFLLLVILFVAAIRWRMSSNRYSELQVRIESLERELRGMRSEGVPANPQPEPEIVAPQREAYQPVPEPLNEPVIVPAQPPPPPPPPPLAPIPVFTISTESEPHPVAPLPVTEKKTASDWEALVGGNWLNKLGILILVIGIALFLGYSFTVLGPAGRSAVALATSLALLATGVIFEKRESYRVFGRGLIGGGWSALYFTVYAMQAIAASKVIESPVLGAILLLAVAVGMILHSLRYRSQAVTGLAYFVTFATLAITPLTTFSVIALIPLAASLLYLAQRFSWTGMSVFGLVATYGTCAARGDSGAPLWQTQLLFAIYWLLFESFDLLRVRRRAAVDAWQSAIFPLNAIAFTTLSFLKWSAAAPGSLHVLAASVAAAYLISAILRTWLRPPSSFDAQDQTIDRILAGGYEAPVTLTVILSVLAVLMHWRGTLAQCGLLAEAELLFVAGLFFKQSYLRNLAVAVFGAAVFKLLTVDLAEMRLLNVAGLRLKSWTPVTAAMAALFYINRVLRKPDVLYGFAGSAAIALIAGFETPALYLGMSWFLLAACLFAIGWAARLQDFRIQGYGVAGLGLAGSGVHQFWPSLAGGAALIYTVIAVALRSGQERMQDWERSWIARIGSWAVTGLSMVLIWRVVPQAYVGAGWLALALVLLELGLRNLPPEFEVQANVTFACGALGVFFANVLSVHNTGPWAPRLTIAAASVLAYAFAVVAHGSSLASRAKRVVGNTSATGTLFLLVALWSLLPTVAVAPAWAASALVLAELGFALDIPSLRLQSEITGGASFIRLFFGNFVGLGRTVGISHRLLTVAPVVVSYYYQWARYRAFDNLRERERNFARLYLYAAAIALVVLLRFEFGRVFTVAAWAACALGLLLAGQRWAVPDLRWQSYAIAALAFFRSWVTNFNAPESFSGVLGRLLAGGIVIACFYAAQLASPRPEHPPDGIERHARLFYSLLASVLLSVLLFHEVSGAMLTVAWGLEGVALLIAGFPLRDRILRLSGLSLFLICILKLFFYDLRQLETFYRILSFIVLGLILVSVSWVYTRFRERIQRYL